MKQLKLSWLWLLSALIISGGIFVGCQKDAAEVPEITSNITSVSSVVPSLACCIAEYAASVKELYKCEDMTITAENDGAEIIVKIVRTGQYPNDHFTRVEYEIYPVGSTPTGLIDDGSTGNRQIATIKVPLANGWQCDDQYVIHLVVKGLGGLDMPNCQVVEEEGEEVENSGRGKLDITRNYAAKALCVTRGCSMSQGYFFAKPQSVWGGEYITSNNVVKVQNEKVWVGGFDYTKAEGSAIFKMTCNSAGKLGFQQVATIYLSIAKGSLYWSDLPASIVTDINTVENFLSTSPRVKLTTMNACNSLFANKSVQAAAGRIGDWIDANHCSE